MKIIITIVIAMLTAGCATPGKFVAQSRDNDCNGKGRSDIVIKYGDAYIDVTARAEIGRKGEIIFKLMPERNAKSGTDYTQVEVEIIGKDADSTWLDSKGKFGKGNDKLNKCVTGTQPFGDYYFKVHVPGVGTIDPRVIVIDTQQF